MRYKVKVTAVICLCFLISILLFGCSFKRNDGDVSKRIAVIVKSVDSDFWNSVNEGVNSASTEYNVSVTFEGPANEEDYMTQNSMIEDAVNDKYDAIVLSAIDEEKTASYVDDAVRSGLCVVTIDSGVRTELADIFIGTDNVLAGETAAKAAAELFYSDHVKSEKMRIGIVSCTAETENIKSREKGFYAAVSDMQNVEIVAEVNVNNNVESATIGAAGLMRENPEINVLVGFNEWTTLGVGYAIKNLSAGDRVLGAGFDTNSVSVGMIETGEMDVLIVQNPFAIGYLGVEYAARLSDGEIFAEKELYTDVTVVTQSNIYDEDIQKIVFRFE